MKKLKFKNDQKSKKDRLATERTREESIWNTKSIIE